MPRIRTMGAGLGGSTAKNVNVNGNTGGGDKKQGLATTTNTGVSFASNAIKNKAYGENRDFIFCVNQLGGIGGKSKMFATTADGVKDCVEGPDCPVLEVKEAYMTVFGRHPDASGIKTYCDNFRKKNWTLEMIVTDLINSVEGQAILAALTPNFSNLSTTVNNNMTGHDKGQHVLNYVVNQLLNSTNGPFSLSQSEILSSININFNDLFIGGDTNTGEVEDNSFNVSFSFNHNVFGLIEGSFVVSVVTLDVIPPQAMITGTNVNDNGQFELSTSVTTFSAADWVQLIGLSVSDETGTPSTNFMGFTGNLTVPGPGIVSFEIVDSSQNTTSVSADILVVDDVPPLFAGTSGVLPSEDGTTFGDGVYDEIIYEAGSNDDLDVMDNVTASDDVDGDVTGNINIVLLSSSGAEVSLAHMKSIPDTYTVTYNVSDTAGNSANQAQRTVISQDTTPPVFNDSIPPNLSIEAGVGAIGDLNTFNNSVTATDAVDGLLVMTANITVVYTNSQGTVLVNDMVSTPGAYTATYSVIDAHNNQSQAIVNVTITDTTPPVISSNDLGTSFEYNSQDLTLNPLANGLYTYNVDVSIDISYSDNVDDESPASTSFTVSELMTGTTLTPASTGAQVFAMEGGKVYKVVYGATDTSGNTATNIVRFYKINDNTIPSITLNGATSMTVEAITGSYAEPGATATDAFGGDLTSSIVTVGSVNPANVGIYIVTYNVSDGAGNIANQVTRTVNVVDSTAPSITLNGLPSLNIELNSTYTDQGAYASDAVDGDLTPNITTGGSVDTTTVGTYTLSYDVNDGAGNQANQVTRTVSVVDTTTPVLSLPATLAGHVVSGDDNYYIFENEVYDDEAQTVTITDNGSTFAMPNNSVGAKTGFTFGGVNNNSITMPHGTQGIKEVYSYSDGTNTGTVTRSLTILERNVVFNAPTSFEYESGDSDTQAETKLLTNVSHSFSGLPQDLVASYPVSITTNMTSVLSGAITSTSVVTITAEIIPGAGNNWSPLSSYGTLNPTNSFSVDVPITEVDTTAPVMIFGSDPLVLPYGEVGSAGSYPTPFTDITVTDYNGSDITSSTAILSNAPTMLATAFHDGTATNQGTAPTTADGNDYLITHFFTDAAGNVATATRTVTVKDQTIPVSTLVGGAQLYLESSHVYIEPGMNVTDNSWNGNAPASGAYTSTGSASTPGTGNVTIATASGSQEINTIQNGAFNPPGNYTINYDASDGAGNNAVGLQRIITVSDPGLSITWDNAAVTFEYGDVTELEALFNDHGFTVNDHFQRDVWVEGFTSTNGGGVTIETIALASTQENLYNNGNGVDVNSIEYTRTVTIVDDAEKTLTGNGTVWTTWEDFKTDNNVNAQPAGAWTTGAYHICVNISYDHTAEHYYTNVVGHASSQSYGTETFNLTEYKEFTLI